MSSELKKFQEMVESSQDWFWEFDENANFTYVSPRIKDLLGYEPEDIVGRNAFDLMAPDEAERVRAHFDPLAQKYLPFNCLENTNLHKDGHEVIIESSGTPFFDEQGRFKGYRGIDRDVTKQRRAERNFRHIFNEMMDGFALHELICDDHGAPVDYRFLKVNPAFEAMTGLDASSLVGRTVSETFPDIVPFWIKAYGEVAQSGQTAHFEYFAKESERFYEIKVYSPSQGQFACIVVDVTSKRKMEQELKDSEERFRSAFVTIPDPVVLARLADGAIVDVNTAFEVETGIQRLTAIGHNSADLGLWPNEENRQAFREELIAHGEIINSDVEFRVHGNTIKPCKLSAKIFSLSGEPHILLIVRDITREKMAERALLEMDKVKNEFISTAAHELRTPLSAIMGFAEILTDDENEWSFSEQQKLEFIGEIYERGTALKAIVDDLLDISRIESGRDIELKIEGSNIEPVIKKSVKLFQSQYPGHTFKTSIPADVGSLLIHVDKRRITQVIENLLSNAAKYSPEGSLISTTCSCTADTMNICIQDNGTGMTEDEAKRVFEKFYRADWNESAIGGLGLGMSIAKQIIEAHKGRIWVESAKGVGSSFTFSLPLASPDSEEDNS